MIKITIKGPQGCGKSTLSRMIAKAIEAEPTFNYNIMYIDDGNHFLTHSAKYHLFSGDILIKTKQQKPTRKATI